MIKIRNLEIGTGRPKICVPIAETTYENILIQAERIKGTSAELVEWRADFLEQAESVEQVLEILHRLRIYLKDIPLIFTFRTANEGGKQPISWEVYAILLEAVAESGEVDLIDVEVFRGYDERLHQKKEWRMTDVCNRKMLDLIEKLSKKVLLIGSYHDFEKTPSKEEVLRRFLFMDRMKVDIPKLAVMPQEREDVLRFMDAVSLAQRLIVDKPLIAMSMGNLGNITRAAGEFFGSSVTFGCMGRESAPGQISVEKLREVLEILHGTES